MEGRKGGVGQKRTAKDTHWASLINPGSFSVTPKGNATALSQYYSTPSSENNRWKEAGAFLAKSRVQCLELNFFPPPPIPPSPLFFSERAREEFSHSLPRFNNRFFGCGSKNYCFRSGAHSFEWRGKNGIFLKQVCCQRFCFIYIPWWQCRLDIQTPEIEMCKLDVQVQSLELLSCATLPFHWFDPSQCL